MKFICCRRFGIPNFCVLQKLAVLFTNLGSSISVLYCVSLIRNRLKMDNLHTNSSFLVVNTNEHFGLDWNMHLYDSAMSFMIYVAET